MLFGFDFELEWVGCYVVVSSRTSSVVLTSADVAAEKRKETKRCDSLGFYRCFVWYSLPEKLFHYS